MYGHVCEIGGKREVFPPRPLHVSRLRIYFEYQSQDRLREPFDLGCNTAQHKQGIEMSVDIND